jgi:hypothetical protein
MITLIHALEKCQQYHLGRKLLIWIDHNSLQYLLQQKKLSWSQWKPIENIGTFDMEILHKNRKDNIFVYALSWKDEEVVSYETSVIVFDWLDEF